MYYVIYLTMHFNFSHEKNNLLKKERNISFEDAIKAIENGGVLDVLNHPTKSQIIFIIKMFDYVYAVPAVIENENCFFLKTVYPSRDLKKQYNI